MNAFSELRDETQKDLSKISYNSEILKEPELKSENNVVIYSNSDGKVTANVFFANDTFWMTQKTMAELFGVKIPAISKHLKNIYITGELNQKATVSKMETVQIEGMREITRIQQFRLSISLEASKI